MYTVYSIWLLLFLSVMNIMSILFPENIELRYTKFYVGDLSQLCLIKILLIGVTILLTFHFYATFLTPHPQTHFSQLYPTCRAGGMKVYLPICYTLPRQDISSVLYTACHSQTVCTLVDLTFRISFISDINYTWI